MKVVLIGGNPKGFDTPFHPSTASGNRLRKIITDIGLDCEIADMTRNRDDNPTIGELVELRERYSGYDVVFLGRFVEKRLRATFPRGMYLPHPASRRKDDHQRLIIGLKNIVKGRVIL